MIHAGAYLVALESFDWIVFPTELCPIMGSFGKEDCATLNSKYGAPLPPNNKHGAPLPQQ